MTHPWFLPAVAILAGCASAGTPEAGAELDDLQLRVGELSRHYLLYSPAGAAALPGERPLVIVLHGGGGTAQGIAREVGRSMHRIADAEGFYVAYPDALDRVWDFGAGKVSEELDVRVDDRAYFGALLDDVLERLPIDPDRVFATGISRGGQASYFIACSYPERIRAIAAVTMPLPEFMLETCRGSPPLGVAILNGTEDPLVPYFGGEITVGRRRRGRVLSTDATVDFWRERNGCGPEAADVQHIDRVDDRMHVTRTSWDDCSSDPVVLYRIEGGGHTWPSGRQYLPRFVVGRVNRDIDGATEIWAFFDRFE